MPIEIKELHIRIAVNSAPSDQLPPNRMANGRGNGTPPADDAKDQLIAECVEQVLQILQQKMER